MFLFISFTFSPGLFSQKIPKMIESPLPPTIMPLETIFLVVCETTRLTAIGLKVEKDLPEESMQFSRPETSSQRRALSADM